MIQGSFLKIRQNFCRFDDSNRKNEHRKSCRRSDKIRQPTSHDSKRPYDNPADSNPESCPLDPKTLNLDRGFKVLLSSWV